MSEETHPIDSESESDADYSPNAEESDVPSEVESDGDHEDFQENDNENNCKSENKKNGVKNRRKNEIIEDEPEILLDNNSDKGEKERTDALWADFLSDTNTLPVSKHKTTKPENRSENVVENKKEITTVDSKQTTTSTLFDVSERTSESNKNILNKSTISTVKPTLITSSFGIKRAGGLGAVLGQINKKSKIGTLEKTKLDWNRFKKSEGIDEEIQTHNRGRGGYLERQDFLERTDFRQFEIEKSVRQSKPNNR